MSNMDFLKSLKDYVEKTTEEFLSHYGQADKFPDIQQKANEALKNFGVSEHFNVYTNGAVQVVASGIGQSEDTVREVFRRYYFSGRFD